VKKLDLMRKNVRVASRKSDISGEEGFCMGFGGFMKAKKGHFQAFWGFLRVWERREQGKEMSVGYRVSGG
jgi:hypothetical protein